MSTVPLTVCALGSTPAAEGIGSVLVTGLGALGAMLLIYAVLVIMERVRRKNAPPEEPAEKKPEPREFSDVLSDELDKRNGGGKGA